MIVALGLRLKVATIILGCILSKLLSDFKALVPISIPTPPTDALTEFFHVDTVASVHPLPVSLYLTSSVCVYLCSWMHIMSMLCSMADAVSSGSCPILFKVLTLNVAICIVCLHFSNCCCLSSVADLSNTSAGHAPFYPREERCGLYMWFEYGFWLSFDGCFYSHPWKPTLWMSSSCSPIELTILTVGSWDSYDQDQVRHCVRPSEGFCLPLRPPCCFPWRS